jgi:hypothetical protein
LFDLFDQSWLDPCYHVPNWESTRSLTHPTFCSHIYLSYMLPSSTSFISITRESHSRLVSKDCHQFVGTTYLFSCRNRACCCFAIKRYISNRACRNRNSLHPRVRSKDVAPSFCIVASAKSSVSRVTSLSHVGVTLAEYVGLEATHIMAKKPPRTIISCELGKYHI